MARTKESKQEILTTLRTRLAQSTAIVFANVQGLKVKDIEALRKALRKEDLDCIVTKKTLLARTFSEAGISDFDFQKMEGEVATVFSYADQVAPARIVHSLAKQLEKLGVIAGMIRDDGKGVQALTFAQVKSLAQLPSRDELRAKVIGSLSSPLRGFVSVLGGTARSLVQVLHAYAESKS